MAYAAVLSVDQILEQISNPHLEQHQTPLQDQQIKSLQENLKFLLDFLDDSWQRRSEELRCLEREIRDAAYKVEDIMESHISKNFGQESFRERQIRDKTFCENFEIVADEIDSIKTKAAKLKELRGATDLHHSQRTSLPTGQSRLPSIGKNDMVGFREDLMEIIDRLTGYPSALQFIQVTGMGGSGKTTLARNVYSDPLIEHHFDIRAWTSISQEYREREVLLSLLDSMEQLSDEMRQENDIGKLKGKLYKSLKGQRYLIVMDDVWATEAWDSLGMIFPDDGNGNRIMLTTRLTSSLVHESSPSYLHRMQFLNETDSWNLLCRNVFGEDSCPSELEEAGKKIAENCKGLPLSLVVIGGHLSNANRTKDHWEYVAQNVKPVVTSTDAHSLEILSLSYDYLPHYLKACFLYMGVFPEDDKIRVSKLIKLWVAEGFLKPVTGKTLEEVAEEYLGDLISRNLIMISEKSSRGKIKTCSIHDMLRDLCLKKAQEEKFFHVRDKDNIFPESIKYSRRLCIHPDILHEEFKCYQSMGSLPAVRSILISGFPSKSYSGGLDKSQINELVDGKLFPLLRVLDLKQLVRGFQFREIKLVHSRYLAFHRFGFGSIYMPKTLPDFLGYLQTLIVDSDDVHLPEEIWRMPQLRHLLFGMCFLPCTTRSPIAGENFVLGNLLTFLNLRSTYCTKEVFERVPNLNKLGIFSSSDDKIFLGTLVLLPQLETLKIKSEKGRLRVPINFTFPPNIKKLTLQDCKIAWKHMTIVGSMPNLEVLKLLDDNIRERPEFVPEWEPTEGEFCKLKFLLLRTSFLVQWRTNNTNFTSLERLMLRECSNLKEIPRSFGDIPTLQIIDLDDASPSAVFSAKQIQEEQEHFGIYSLQVRVKRESYLPKEEVQRINELKAEAIANLESNDEELQISACFELSWIFYVSRGIDPSSEGFISGIVPRLLEFLDRVDYRELQLAAARVIEHISLLNSWDDIYINILIEQGVVPTMASLLSSLMDELRRKINELKAETIANLESNDDELRISACNELSDFIYVSRGIDPPSEGFISGIVPRLLEFLDRVDYRELQLAAARVIEHISLLNSWDDIYINILIEQGAGPTMASLLSSLIDELRRKEEVQWINELTVEPIADLEPNDYELQITAFSELRDFIFVYRVKDPPSEGFIFAIVPRLLEFLDRIDYPELQLAAARVIELISLLISPDDSYINILIKQGVVPTMASLVSSVTDELRRKGAVLPMESLVSSVTDELRRKGAVPTMASLVSSVTDELRRKALEVLGRIASVSAESRDLVLSHGVLMPLLEQFNDETKQSIITKATKTLSKLCQRKPRFEQVKSAILPLAHLLHTVSGKVIGNACMTLFHLTCGEMDMKQAVIDAVIEAGAFPRLFELLPRLRFSLPMHIVGNIISYVDDTQIQVIIDNGSLPPLCELFTQNNDLCVKEATCHIISNIIGRTNDHIQAVIEAGIISPLLPLLQDVDLFNAAAEVIYNITTKGTNEQIRFLVHEGCIEPMCDLLVNSNEVHVIKISLEGLENILKVGEAEKNQGNTEDVNVFAQMIVDAGLEKIKNLQTHDNSKIREQAEKILETYW